MTDRRIQVIDLDLGHLDDVWVPVQVFDRDGDSRTPHDFSLVPTESVEVVVKANPGDSDDDAVLLCSEAENRVQITNEALGKLQFRVTTTVTATPGLYWWALRITDDALQDTRVVGALRVLGQPRKS